MSACRAGEWAKGALIGAAAEAKITDAGPGYESDPSPLVQPTTRERLSHAALTDETDGMSPPVAISFALADWSVC